jgi:hypothetical protein
MLAESCLIAATSIVGEDRLLIGAIFEHEKAQRRLRACRDVLLRSFGRQHLVGLFDSLREPGGNDDQHLDLGGAKPLGHLVLGGTDLLGKLVRFVGIPGLAGRLFQLFELVDKGEQVAGVVQQFRVALGSCRILRQR